MYSIPQNTYVPSEPVAGAIVKVIHVRSLPPPLEICDTH